MAESDTESVAGSSKPLNLNYSIPYAERPEGFAEEREERISAGPGNDPDAHNRFFQAYSDRANQVQAELMELIGCGQAAYERLEEEINNLRQLANV